MLNWAIIKHPVNWIIVLLMTVIGMILLNLVLTPWHLQQKSSAGLDANSTPGPDLATSQ